MEESILKGTKKILGLDAAYTAFDHDVITHINTAFSTLSELGVGPDDGFAIEDETAEWNLYLGGDNRLNSIRTYVFLKVRLLFDPPTTGYLIDAYNKQIQELEWRISTVREGDEWTDPDPQEAVIDGE